jgi:peptidoglycan/LPS O-acetylase OafA/YrhL
VLSVIAYHFFPGWVKGGFVGVDIFFVISGFLIGGILLDAVRENRFSLLDFYARRARCILPALLLVLVSSLAFGWFFLLPDDYQNLGKHSAGGAGFVANLLYWQEAGYFDTLAERKPLLHPWSLGIEEQFYIAFPLLLYGLWRKNLRLATFLFLLAWASYKWNLVLYKKDPTADFYSPLARFWELLAGVLLALWERRGLAASQTKSTDIPQAPEHSRLRALWHRLAQGAGSAARVLFFRNAERAKQSDAFRSFLSVLGLVLLALACFKAETRNFPGKQALVPALGTVLLIAAGRNAWANCVLLASRPAVWVGLISYPLYLWHWPLLAFSRVMLNEMPDRLWRVGLLAAAFLLAFLTYRFIERPVRFGKRARGAKTIALLVLLALTGGGGAWVYKAEGFKSRFSPEDIDLLVSREQRTEYVIHRYGAEWNSISISENSFSISKKSLKILLIGDSFSQDLFNMIHEANLLPLQNIDLRALFIPNTCGLYRGSEDVWTQFVSKHGLSHTCTKISKDPERFYASLDTKINEADVVLIARAWKEWEVDRLLETLKNFSFPPSTRVIVVGSKRSLFYIKKPKSYLGMSIAEKRSVRIKRQPYNMGGLIHYDPYDSSMRENLKSNSVEFIDIFTHVCGGEDGSGCPAFTDDGLLISYDDGHLTQAGAKYIGQKLAAHPVFQSLNEEIAQKLKGAAQ